MEQWKRDFYTYYPTLNNRIVSGDAYKAYEPYGEHIIRLCFPPDKNIHILDMGCGFGGFLKVCQNAGYNNIQGIDISEENVNIAHSFGMDKVMQGELFDSLSSLQPEIYDMVLYQDVIEHFNRQEIITILKETNRILKKGGRVIVHVPNAEGIFGSRIRYADFTHEMSFTPHALSQVFQFCGYTTYRFFEDKPIVHGLLSLIRRLVWSAGTFPFRLLHAAETGSASVILSQNILCLAIKS